MREIFYSPSITLTRRLKGNNGLTHNMSEQEVQTKESGVERNNKKITHGVIEKQDNGDIHLYLLSKDNVEVKTCNCTNLANALTNVVVKMRKDSRVKVTHFVVHDDGGIYFRLELGEDEVEYVLFRDGKEVFSSMDSNGVRHTALKTNLVKILITAAAVTVTAWLLIF